MKLFLKHSFGLLLVVSVMVMVNSCKPKDENLHPDERESNDSLPEVTAGRKLVYQDCNAVVVGEGVRLRAKPDTKSEVIVKLNTGTLLKVIKTDGKLVQMGKPDACNPDGFFWHEVITSDGDLGWIYGEFMYNLIVRGRNDELTTENERLLLTEIFKIDGKEFSLGMATSGKRNSATEEADPLCADFLIPFFYIADQGKAYPIKLIRNPKNQIPFKKLTADKDYLRMTRGSINDEVIEYYKSEPKQLLFTVGRAVGDDEPFWYTLVLKPGESFFTATPTDPGSEYLP